MKWVFCLNDAGASSYPFELAKVAIYTAKKYTSLDPVCLYDGTDENFLNYLKNENVLVIQAESPIKNKVKYLIENSFILDHIKDKQKFLDFAAGAFLRFEIHKYLEDNYCLYTDYDVMFTDKFQIPEKMPHNMSMSYEIPKNKIYPHFFLANLKREYNTGVIWFNLHCFKNMYNDFIANCLENVFTWSKEECDQGAVNHYCYDSVKPLDSVYNWRPAKGINEEAQIIHFQRVKPLKETDDFYYRSNKGINSYKYYEKEFFRLLEELNNG